MFAYRNKGTENRTLMDLQTALADSLNLCNLPGQPHLDGFSIHVVASKGDWKYRREFLALPRHYGRKDFICARCMASAAQNADRPYIDPVRERFNAPESLEEAAATRVGPGIALLRVRGWDPACEQADLLHAFFLGTGRDAIGSLLLELAEHWQDCAHLETWNQRLAFILSDFQKWASANGIRPSTVDEISGSDSHHEHPLCVFPF